jgi:hypothetical protein
VVCGYGHAGRKKKPLKRLEPDADAVASRAAEMAQRAERFAAAVASDPAMVRATPREYIDHIEPIKK